MAETLIVITIYLVIFSIVCIMKVNELEKRIEELEGKNQTAL